MGHCKTYEGKSGRVSVVVGFILTHLFSFAHTPLAFGEGCEEYVAQSVVWKSVYLKSSENPYLKCSNARAEF